MLKFKLGLELIPEGSWGKSLAQILPRHLWDIVRRSIYKRFNYNCAICGETGIMLHCHEVWEFKKAKKVQYLKGFQSICEKCHSIKHWGRTTVLFHEGKITEEYYEGLKKHFCEVNNTTLEDFTLHKVEQGNLWLQRSRMDLRVDFGRLKPEVIEKVWLKGKDQGLKEYLKKVLIY